MKKPDFTSAGMKEAFYKAMNVAWWLIRSGAVVALVAQWQKIQFTQGQLDFAGIGAFVNVVGVFYKEWTSTTKTDPLQNQ